MMAAVALPRKHDRRTEADDLQMELDARNAELADDLRILIPAASLFASIAVDFGPTVLQTALGMQRRIGRMQRRLEGDPA